MPSHQNTRPQQDRPVVQPTRQDEVAAAGSELFGGPIGRWARLGGGHLTPVRVIALVAIGMFALGMGDILPYPLGNAARAAVAGDVRVRPRSRRPS